MKALKPVLCSLLSIGALSFSVLASAEPFYILKDLSVDISKYPSAQSLPTKLDTSKAVIDALGHSNDVAVHIDILERAYAELPMSHQESLLEAIHQRHRDFNEDALRFFDHGMAQFLFRQNKMALYHLRKANDRLKSPFTNLVYALAQVEVDLNDEQASPETMNNRKLDVTYKLNDAVVQDVEQHAPGFWQSFVAILEELATIPAYRDFVTQDFTQTYMAYGERILPSTNMNEPLKEAVVDSGTNATVCSLPTTPKDLNWNQLYRSVPMDLTGDGQNEVIHFFYKEAIAPGDQRVLNVPPPTDETIVSEPAPTNFYRVVVINQANQVMADFTTGTAPYITEDIDEDHVPELVVRQYRANKLNPLMVYRLEGCQFKLDETVSSYFN